MRSYESIFITAPNVAPDAYDQLVGSYEELIGNGGGTLHKTDKWGRRTLAYEINRFKEGVYTIFHFDGDGDLVKELERRYRLNDSVLKFMTIKTDRQKRLQEKGAKRRKKKQDAKAKRRASKSSDQ